MIGVAYNLRACLEVGFGSENIQLRVLAKLIFECIGLSPIAIGEKIAVEKFLNSIFAARIATSKPALKVKNRTILSSFLPIVFPSLAKPRSRLLMGESSL